MANIFLTLNLKEKFLTDDEDKLNFDFKHWDYDLKNRIFRLDDLSIAYDLISDFVFDRNISTDVADVEIEDNTVIDLDVYNDYEDYLENDLDSAVNEFIADRDLADGEYEVKYTYYYDFGDESFVCEVQEVYKK